MHQDFTFNDHQKFRDGWAQGRNKGTLIQAWWVYTVSENITENNTVSSVLQIGSLIFFTRAIPGAKHARRLLKRSDQFFSYEKFELGDAFPARDTCEHSFHNIIIHQRVTPHHLKNRQRTDKTHGNFAPILHIAKFKHSFLLILGWWKRLVLGALVGRYLTSMNNHH